MIRRTALVLLALVLAVVLVTGGAVALLAWRPGMLKGPLESILSTQLDAPVQIRGPLDLDLGRITVAEIQGLRVAAPPWASTSDLASIGRLRVGVDVAAYLRDRLIRLTELTLDEPRLALERDAAGRTSWPSKKPSQPADTDSASASTPTLPEIEALTIRDGAATYRDATTDVELATTIATAESTGSNERFAGLRIQGNGRVRKDEVNLAFEIGSPLLLGQGGQPFPIKGELTFAGTRVRVDGGATDPLSLDGLALALDVASDDPRSLLALAGRTVEAALPALTATGRFSREHQVLAVSNLDLRWGESQILGRLRYDPTGQRPAFDGELRAPLLDLVALQPLTAAPSPGPETTSTTAPGPLSTHDGMLEVRVNRIRLPQGELTDVMVDARLDQGRLAVERMQLGLPDDGTLGGRLTTGSLDQPLTAELDLTGKQIALTPWLSSRNIAGRISGRLSGTVQGTSVDELLARSRLRFEGDVAALRAAGLAVETLAGTVQLAEGKLTADPLQASLPAGRIAGRIASGPLGETLRLDLNLSGENIDLAQFITGESPVGGRLNGRVEGTLQGNGAAEILRRSNLHLVGDLRALRLPSLEDRLREAHIDARLAAGAERPLQVVATGSISGTPLRLEAQGGDPQRLTEGTGAYPVRLHAVLGETEANADGNVTLPFNAGRIAASLSLKGPDPGKVLALFDLPAIELPPYQLAGSFARNGSLYRMSEIQGRIGDSDVSGELAVRLGEPRPAISGSLRSRLLDLDDLGGLVGAKPAAEGGETASPEQRQEARAEASDNKVLPDDRLDPARWRQLDLDVKLAAEKVQAGSLPFDGFNLGVLLEGGRLRVDPLVLRLGEGQLEGRAALDARRAPAAAELDVDLRRLPVGRLLNRLAVDTASFGTLSGRARGGMDIGGRGLSVKEILSHGNGDVTLIMEGGTIDRRIVSALGFDLLRLFGSLLGGSPPQLELRCTLADLALRDGVLTTRSLVVDTPIADIGGEGNIDLGSERINLELIARPESAPLPSGRTGIRVTGTLANPDISFNAVTLAARGAVAATFGVLLRPFTALASTVAQSTPRQSPCAGLLERGDETGG